MSVHLQCADCLDILRELDDESVHAIVTDPPYGLSNTDPAHVVETLTRWASGDRTYTPSGRGFMGKEWDAFVPPPAVWDECLRVLKPGGHLLAFAGSRTFDLMTLSIRFAGFDIRDGIAWLYGSGFPKSLDVSKAIDKRPGVNQHAEFAADLRAAMATKGYTNTFDVAEAIIGRRTGAVANWQKYQFPAAQWWPALRDLLDMSEEKWGPVIAEAERAKTGIRTTGIGTGNGAVSIMRDGDRALRDDPVTDDARVWQGWGTALKPAFEPIVVARKPLPKGSTVAANVLAHGTGALNIDATRVAHGEPAGLPAIGAGGARSGGIMGTQATALRMRETTAASTQGRWPVNVVLDGHTADALDEQGPHTRDGVAVNRNRTADNDRAVYSAYSMGNDRGDDVTYGGEGGPSRFFPTFRYQAKASTRERPFYEREDGARVAHPTVKPVELMRWLVRLVTPPGGLVLDPFAGSGATVEAAMLEGFDVVAVERDADYLPLIAQRMSRVTPLTGEAS